MGKSLELSTIFLTKNFGLGFLGVGLDLYPMKNFLKWVSSSNAAMRYALISCVISMVYFILQKMHARDGVADFRVYYDAANAIMHNTQLYGIAFGVSSGFYKYSPFAALPFIPLAILPYAVASAIYYFIVLVAFIYFSLLLLYFLEKHAGFEKYNKGWALAIITLFLADHFERELHLGNVNVFLLIGSFLVFVLIHKGKHWLAGLVYAFILLYKPHFVILLPLFVLQLNWRLLLTTAGGIGMGLLLPMIWKGWGGNNTWLHQWLGTMQEHNVKLEESPNTIYGIYTHFVAQPLGLQSGAFMVVVLLCAVAALVLWFMLHKILGESLIRKRYMTFFLLIALIPNLAHTDTEHFMWTWPLIAYTILQLMQMSKKRQWIYGGILALAFIPYCLNSPDIVGKPTQLLFDEGGLLGVANLVIIAVSVHLYLKFGSRQEVHSQTT